MLQIPLALLRLSPEEGNISGIAALDEAELAQCLLAGYRLRHLSARQTPADQPPEADELQQPLPRVVPVTASSATLGLQGEQAVERALAARYKVLRTADQSASADLRVLHEGLQIMVEVKNYSRAVPPVELEKLERDLEMHSEVAGALVVSLRSPFVGSDAALRLQNSLDGRPLLLLHLAGTPARQAPDLLCTVLQILLLEAARRRAISSPGIEQMGFARVCAHLEYVSELIAQQGQLRYRVAQLRASVSKQCDQLSEALLTTEVRVQERLSTLLDLLAQHQVPPADVAIPRKSMVRLLLEQILALPACAPVGGDPDATALRLAFCQGELGRGALSRLLLALREHSRAGGLKKVFHTSTARYVQVRVGRLLVRFRPLRTKLFLDLVFPEDVPVVVPRYAEYKQHTITADIDRPFLSQHLDALCEFLSSLPALPLSADETASPP